MFSEPGGHNQRYVIEKYGVLTALLLGPATGVVTSSYSVRLRLAGRSCIAAIGELGEKLLLKDGIRGGGCRASGNTKRLGVTESSMITLVNNGTMKPMNQELTIEIRILWWWSHLRENGLYTFVIIRVVCSTS